jgi:hypothetical protein
MYSIKYTHKAYLKIDNFVNSYKSTFIKIYSDTWIEDEKLIIKNYIEVWERFYENIKNKLEDIFTQEIILWKFIDAKQQEHVVLSINNFRMFVYYNEDWKRKERYIDDIEFSRR